MYQIHPRAAMDSNMERYRNTREKSITAFFPRSRGNVGFAARRRRSGYWRSLSTVTSYQNEDGTAGGKIIDFVEPVFDPDPDPHENNPEKIGELRFQFAPWRGHNSQGANGGGAGLFCGFHLTDTDDIDPKFSFRQLVL